MMNETNFRNLYADLPLGGIRYYNQIGSTNDVALAWAGGGAPDLSLVYAEGQTSGRGRGNRTWYTYPGTGLAFSLVLKIPSSEVRQIPLFSMLGALGICEALSLFGLHAEIKWPNDVIIARKKVCGILAEAVWLGDRLEGLVLGIGLNVTRKSLPPAERLLFPSTSLEAEWDILKQQSTTQEMDK